MRDERIIQAESELRRVTDEYRKLREELLPVFRMAKDRSQPLPFQPTASGHSPDYHNHNDGMASPVTSQAPLEKSGATASRKFPTTQKLFLGSTPKNNSPTQIPHSIPEGKPLADMTNLDPSAAVTLASNHLAAQTINGVPPSNSPSQVNLPSPTSPSIYNNQQPLPPHIYSRPNGNPQTSTRQVYPHSADELYSSNAPTLAGSDRDRSNPTPTPTGSTRQPRQPDEPPPSGGGQREAPSVDIVKKFRVSVDDPCYKVLPAALKKYNINAPWRQYSLYIVYGDQERCLALDEKPLELFKQLNLEGRKPMFMLRRHATPTEGHSGPSAGGGMGGVGFDPAMGLGTGRGYQSSIQLTQLPGGVL